MRTPHETPPSGLTARLAAAGVVGAGVSLAVGELASGITRRVPSLVVATGEWLVDVTPGAAVRTGIDAAGTADKPLLLAGVVLVALAIGAAAGRALVRRGAWVVLAVFGAFGLFGGFVAARNPFSSGAWSWVVALGAAGCGAAVTLALARAAAVVDDALAVERAPDPVEAGRLLAPTGRRRFLVTVGSAGALAAIGAVAGRAARGRFSVEGARRAVALPPAAPSSGAASAAELPAGAATFDAVDGITPLVTANRGFYRIDTALTIPQVDPASWKLRIDGLVDRPLTLTYDDILAMDLVEVPVTLSCVSNEVGGRLVGNARWRGVPLSSLLERAGVQPGAQQVLGRSVDGFTAGFPVDALRDGRTALLAVGMNGEPLPVAHGFPARLVVAGLYGYVSAVKWLDQIRLTTRDVDGYWIPRGWAKDGPIKTSSRIDVPRPGARVPAGRVAVAGVAWAPSRGIRSVEVQVDDGEWQPCRLAPALSADTWVQWVYEWDARPGTYRLRVRATDGRGDEQSARSRPPDPDGAEGLHSVRVTVR